jgi:hypothetical protein
MMMDSASSLCCFYLMIFFMLAQSQKMNNNTSQADKVAEDTRNNIHMFQRQVDTGFQHCATNCHASVIGMVNQTPIHGPTDERKVDTETMLRGAYRAFSSDPMPRVVQAQQEIHQNSVHQPIGFCASEHMFHLGNTRMSQGSNRGLWNETLPNMALMNTRNIGVMQVNQQFQLAPIATEERLHTLSSNAMFGTNTRELERQYYRAPCIIPQDATNLVPV